MDCCCDRCGEKMRQVDLSEKEKVFQVSYRTMGFAEEGAHQWRTLYLCMDCQKELRREFYYRGLMRNDKQEEEEREQALRQVYR